MDKNEARDDIKRIVPCTQYLNRAPHGGYICPFCHSGEKDNRTGALHYYQETNTFHCFACDRSGDVLDVYQEVTGADYNTALSLLAAENGIAIDAPAGRRERPQSENKKKNDKMTDDTTKKATAAEKADYTKYYRECRERLTDPEAAEYLTGRGISIENAYSCFIGYDPAADPANAPGGSGNKAHPAKRTIIPSNGSHYVGRSIDPATPKEYQKINARGSTPGIFNIHALYDENTQPIFVTEGTFTALSIREAGADAIALNSAGNYNKLLERLQKKPTAKTLILCFDNDDTGEKDAQSLAAGLTKNGTSFIIASVPAEYNDANDMLREDPAGLAQYVKAAKMKAGPKPDNTKDYLLTAMAAEIDTLRKDNARKTGYHNLDEIIGNLYSGLYVIGGISSVGKTTFTAQMADQMAAAGQHVLFFSMEQSRLEVVSKSISRRTAQIDVDHAVSSLQIRLGATGEIISQAAREYLEATDDRLSVIEGNLNCDVPYIGNYTKEYIKRNGVRPVVIVDYLQVLAAAADPDTGRKQSDITRIVSDNMTMLKRISRGLEVPVIVISSINRSNYLTPIDFESFKESGSIEFTADMVLGLQLTAIHDEIFSSNKITEKRDAIAKAKQAIPRSIELTCLKNRFGKSNFDCTFRYYPQFDYFQPFELPGGNDGFTPIDERAARY